jgi:uroporphyrinogen-III decarboxylase
MEIGSLKRDFGQQLCFWGGIALDHLILGTPEDVRRNVRESLERGARRRDSASGAGFILGPSHSIAKGTKYENFLALLDEFDRLKDAF